jgi:site-specific DNA-cytosine methylase
VVRDAFIRHGHDAVSCDLLPSDTPGPHYQSDVRDLLDYMAFDLMIAHPPCTDLAVSGARWFKEKQADGRQQAALDFVQFLLDAPVPRIALENPVSIISSRIRKPNQVIQPWQFGHPETKATCLWLKNLPELKETDNVREYMMTLTPQERNRVHRMPPGPDRWKLRSTTFTGIAEAMAEQWGGLAPL